MGRTPLNRAIVIACMALAAIQASLAGSWRADPTAGELTFEATQAGARFTGSFERFGADIAFDPAAADACRFDVTIETVSARTGESQRDGLLQGPDFFWTERYPSASYRGSGCRHAGPGFELDGALTLRGVTRPVKLEFSFAPGPGGGRISGSAILQRLDFGVGQGQWADTEWVGDAVTVRFDLALAPTGHRAVK